MPVTTAAVAPEPQALWWRLPIVWLVIGGPLAVVIASFVTLALAVLNPDPVISVNGSDRSVQPAVQARNHAATPQR